MFIEVAVAILGLFLLSQYCWPPKSPHSLPRVGPPTTLGYIWTAFRFTFNHPELIEAGVKQFSGRPFLLPTLSGSIVVIGAENLEFWRTIDDTAFSMPAFADEFLQLQHTMNDSALKNPYHIAVARTDLARAIPSLIPTLFEEMVLAFDKTLNMPNCGESDSISFPVLGVIVPLIGRITSRAMVGMDLCRNPSYVHAVLNYAKSIFLYSRVLRWCPKSLRSVVYFVLSSLFGGKKETLDFLVPFIKEYIQQRDKTDDLPATLVEFLCRVAPPEDIANPHHLAMRILALNFASIHTSSLFISTALFKLATIHESEREEMRVEIRETLVLENGWNKASLDRLYKLDSYLREVGRLHQSGKFGLFRWTVRDGILPNGTIIPAGHMVSVNTRSVHEDPNIYPDPEVFDTFRFLKLREEEEGGVKHGFASVNKNFLVWGIGRHACAGRLFASTQIKMILAYILINYDVALPTGITELPKSFYLEGMRVPDVKAQLVFKRTSEDLHVRFCVLIHLF